MTESTAILSLREVGRAVPVVRAEGLVLERAGLYSIFVDSAASLPKPFGTLLDARKTRLLYVGCSEASLKQRLLEQDCEHRQASTFFRGLAAVLGYRPEPGSLCGKKNQNNYRFSEGDTREIIAWIRAHLSVCAVSLPIAEVASLEKAVIDELKPILNTKHNPSPCPELANLRDECRKIAQGVS